MAVHPFFVQMVVFGIGAWLLGGIPVCFIAYYFLSPVATAVLFTFFATATLIGIGFLGLIIKDIL